MYMMKMPLATIGLICLFYFNVIYCSPIYLSDINSCNIASNHQEFDPKQLEGDWFELARTKFIYKANTWKNGFASFVKLNETIKLRYSGRNSSNKCEHSELSIDPLGLFVEIEGSLKVLNYSNSTVTLAVCLSSSMCDLFVWSRIRLNTTNDNQSYSSWLNEYCKVNDDDLYISDLSADLCQLNNSSAKEDENEHFIVIAELKFNDNSTQSNRSDSIEIHIDEEISNSTHGLNFAPMIIENKTDVQSNLIDLDENDAIDPDDSDIMIIGLNKNPHSSKFEPTYIEIETGSGESEVKSHNLLSFSMHSQEIGLKKQITSGKSNESTESNSTLEATKYFQVEQTAKLIETTTVESLNVSPLPVNTISNDEIQNSLEVSSSTAASINTDSFEEKDSSQEAISDTDSFEPTTTTLPVIDQSEESNANKKVNDSDENKSEDISMEDISFTTTIQSKISQQQENSTELEEIVFDATSNDNKKETTNSNEIFTEEIKITLETLSITTNTTPTMTISPTTTTTIITTTIPAYPCPDYQCNTTVCKYGYKKDENDCNTCDCLRNPDNSSEECNTSNCHPCFYGSFTDWNGCDSCNCKPRPKPKSIYECPKLDCVSCNYGSIKDEYGCETCICIRPNSLEPSYQCSAIPVCPYGPCKHGSVLNDFGCPTCDCLKSVVPNRDECIKERCQPCQHGYFMDSEGCETCMCKPEWMAPCGQLEISCDSNLCKHGTYLDRNGCPSCECLPDPSISSMSCLEMQETNGQTECNKDGSFKSKQCNDQECRCVTKDGIPISDFKTPLIDSQYMNCECALALYDVSVFKAVGFKLYCESNGNYETIQCVGSSCACVNEHGDPLGPSVPIYQKHLLRCEGVFQRVYHDQYMTTIAPMTLTPPLCVYHRERAEEMSNLDPHMSIPICDEKGLYKPLQCDRNAKYCWCVNIHNGVELNGSRKTGQEPDCSELSG